MEGEIHLDKHKMAERRKKLQNRSFLEHHYRPKTMLHVLLTASIIFLIICGIECIQNGGLSLRTYARINDTFEIRCYVSHAGGKLDFYDDDDLVPESFLKRINDSYVIYSNAYSKPTKRNITCKRKDERRNKFDNVGMSEIYVDGEIAPVNDFKCRTSDFQNLTCTFNPPSSVFTNKYHLSYAKNNGKKLKKCKLDIDDYGGRTCRINTSSDSIQTTYSFALHAENFFYEKVEKFQMHLLESLIPLKLNDAFVRVSKPEKYAPSNASLIFTLPKGLEKASRDLIFNVQLKAEGENDSMWKNLMFSQYHVDNYLGVKITLPIDNLKYANAIYQYKLRIKSKTSQENEEMWSPYLIKTFKTISKLPEMIPKVCENCFNVMDNGNIFLHWMDVPKLYHNGNNFSYYVRIMGANKTIFSEERIERSMIMISKDINATAITVQIYSLNNIGLSERYSTAHIPIGENKKLLNIKKELIDDIGYKLSWKLQVVDVIDVVSYTILFCRQRNELPNQCDSSINFLELPSNKFEFLLNTTHTFQFGVAVNRIGRNSASGFQWAMCTASKPNEIGVIRFMWSRYVTENSISLEWKLNCADKDIVYGYNISYCTVADYDRNLCMENPKYEVIYDNHENRNIYQISSLKPYKQYNISVALISTSDRIGAFSTPITVRTLEASPTAPRSLEAVDIAYNAITLLWQRPLEINGPSLTYQVWFNNKMLEIDNNETMNESYRYTIDNLRAFTNYSVTVLACTRSCSEPSTSLHLRTAISKPGPMKQITLNYFENGSIFLSWEKPNILAGHLDYYLLNITDDSGEMKFYKINGHRTNCIMDMAICDKSYIEFSIRAVNIDVEKWNSVLPEIPSSESSDCLTFSVMSNNDNKYDHFYGDMSVSWPVWCYSSAFSAISRPSFVVALIITSIVLLVIIIYIFIRIYNRVQEMKDIHIVWPVGMESDSLNKTGNNNSNNSQVKNIDDDDFMKTDQIISHTFNDSDNFVYSLSDIKEESIKDLEIYESALKIKEIEETDCHNIKDFARVPFIPKSKTCKVISDGSVDDFKIAFHSLPSSPNHKDSHIEESTGYMKMYSPVRYKSSINNVTPTGYCDMSGKSSSTNINHSNEIKTFLRDSLANDGYIQRKSIMHKPFPIVTSSSGYIGLKNIKN